MKMSGSERCSARTATAMAMFGLCSVLSRVFGTLGLVRESLRAVFLPIQLGDCRDKVSNVVFQIFRRGSQE